MYEFNHLAKKKDKSAAVNLLLFLWILFFFFFFKTGCHVWLWRHFQKTEFSKMSNAKKDLRNRHDGSVQWTTDWNASRFFVIDKCLADIPVVFPLVRTGNTGGGGEPPPDGSLLHIVRKKGLFLIRTAAQSFDPGRCASVKIYFGMIGDWPASFMFRWSEREEQLGDPGRNSLSFFFVYISLISVIRRRKKKEREEEGPLDFAKYSHTSRRLLGAGGGSGWH